MSETKLDGQSGVSHIWKLYRRGVDHNYATNLYLDTEEAHHFFEGDQWHYLPTGKERLPVMNFIQPIVEYKTAMVALQNIQMVFTPLDLEEPEAQKFCDVLGKYASNKWEHQKMDSKSWTIVKDACIAGDSYIYFYNKNVDSEILDRTQVYFADERLSDLQKQEYIIIHERKSVRSVRAEAKKNGIKADEIKNIVADSPDDTEIGYIEEVNKDEDYGNCTSLLYMYRDDDGYIHFLRSTRNVIYEKDTKTKMKLYPLASYRWTDVKNSARGVGEVKWLIANQIAVNRTLVQRLNSVKMNAFAKPVYDETKVENPQDIMTVGSPIKVRSGGVQRVRDMFDYIAPAPMSQEAPMLQNELVTQSRELASAGNATLGQIDPKRASGAAIIAVQDQAAIPLNEQVAMFKQFIEDIALVWIDMWQAYGHKVTVYTKEEDSPLIRRDTINKQAFSKVKLNIKVETSATSPFSKYAREQSLMVFLQEQRITFEEFVDLLDEDSTTPKSKLQAVIQRRQIQQALEAVINPMGVEQDMGGGMAGGQHTQIPREMGGVHGNPSNVMLPGRATTSAMPQTARGMFEKV